MFRRYAALALLTVFLAGCAFSLRVSLEQRGLAGKLIRLHVVAASDAPADQARKLAVRDALLPRIAALTAGCSDADSAARALEAGLPALRETAARALGTGEPVTLSLAREHFPRRDYDSFSLPAGVYRALRIRLGAAQGRNWWCVAFPALCLPAAEEEAEAAAFEEAAQEAGIFDEELALMSPDTPRVALKFRLLDWLAAVFAP